MLETIQGKIHGRTIILASDLGLEDGQKVEVILRQNKLPPPPPGWRPDGKETAAGMLADDWTDAADRILEEIQRERKAFRFREEEQEFYGNDRLIASSFEGRLRPSRNMFRNTGRNCC